MKKLLSLVTATLLTASLVGATPAAAQAEPAAHFQFTAMDGKSVRLSDFKGQWVLVKFWAPWCPLCFTDVPAMNELDARTDVVVIGVAMDYGYDASVVLDTIRMKGMRYHAQVLGGRRIDADSPSRQIAEVMFYPTSYLFAPDGASAGMMVGPLSASRVAALMQRHSAQSLAARGEETAGKRRRG